MANTSFTNRKIRIPIKVSNGGTGRSTLSTKALLVGAGTGNIHTISPGTSGKVLISNGLDWGVGVASVLDSSVSYSKLASDLVGKGVISSVDIDWSVNSIFTKTLTTNTTFTFSNYQLNKNITLVIDGNYTLSLPNTVKKIIGLYIGTTVNYITLHCIKSSAPQEVLAFINQEI
jgi:hypothetical protein